MSMFNRQLASFHFDPMRMLVAFALCYGMMIQGFTAHFAPVWAGPDALHKLCMPDSAEATRNSSPADPMPDHSRHAPCCLIFGNYHLPKDAAIASVVAMDVTSNSGPLAEFTRSLDKRITYLPSLPRPPPQIV